MCLLCVASGCENDVKSVLIERRVLTAPFLSYQDAHYRNEFCAIAARGNRDCIDVHCIEARDQRREAARRAQADIINADILSFIRS